MHRLPTFNGTITSCEIQTAKRTAEKQGLWLLNAINVSMKGKGNITRITLFEWIKLSFSALFPIFDTSRVVLKLWGQHRKGTITQSNLNRGT